MKASESGIPQVIINSADLYIGTTANEEKTIVVCTGYKRWRSVTFTSTKKIDTVTALMSLVEGLMNEED